MSIPIDKIYSEIIILFTSLFFRQDKLFASF